MSSTIKVDKVRHTDGSADNITLDSSQNVTVEGNLTIDGNISVAGTGLTDTLSHRNKLHNPDLKVWQRAASFSPTTSSVYTADRWQNACGASFNQDTTVTKSTDVPTNAGTAYSIKIEADAAVTPSGGDNMVFRQRLEGRDLHDFDFGGANAKGLVASFWCKCNSSAAGAYSFSPRFFDSSGNGYGQIHNFTPTTSWARYTFVLAANGKALDTSIATGNAVGFEFAIHLATGSSDVVSAHSTWASQGWAGTGSKNFMDDAANEIYFTGFQLEAGSAVTDLEVLSYQDELLRCQRYLYMIFSNSAGEPLGLLGYLPNTSVVYYSHVFPVPMKGGPTFSKESSFSVKHISYDDSGSSDSGLTQEVYNANPRDNSVTAVTLKFTVAGLGDAGTCGQLQGQNAGWIKWEAEV